jgi:hypothetical protein
LHQVGQREQTSIVIGLHAQRLAGPQLIESTRARVGAQELLRGGIGYRQARQHAAQRIASGDELFAPVGVGAGKLAEHRRGQVALNSLRRDVGQHRVRGEAERGDRADGHEHDHRKQARRHRAHADRARALR